MCHFILQLAYSTKNVQYPFSKLVINCCRDECNTGKIIDIDGIAEIRVLYDYTNFKNKNTFQKKCDALHILMNGLSEVAEKFSLDMTPYRTIESMIISYDYKNIWIWKRKWNNNRKYNASVYVDHDVYRVIIGLRIADKNETIIYSKELVTTKPDEWDYAHFLGKLFWQDNNEVVLLDKENRLIGKWSAK